MIKIEIKMINAVDNLIIKCGYELYTESCSKNNIKSSFAIICYLLFWLLLSLLQLFL